MKPSTIAAALSILQSLTGCDLCDVAQPGLAQWCDQGAPRPTSVCWCDYNADGEGDLYTAELDGGVCMPPPGPGVCV
jgi:hypothetical protein